MSAALSFVRRGSRVGAEKATKYPLRRVEPLLRKYFKVFQINLDRMQQHKVNIQRFLEADSLPDLTREYVYTLQSVQQLTATVWQIQQTRSQVEGEDIVTLDHRLTNLFNGAMLLLAEFLLLNNDDSDNTNKLRRAYSSTDDVDSTKTIASLCRQHSLLQLVHVDRVDCLQAWTRLKTKLLEFNDTMQKLFLLIETHCSTEEELLSNAQQSQCRPTSSALSSLKCMVMPVAGAVLGGAVGGPVGIVAGLKAAKLAAFSGGILGLTGGTFMKKKSDTSTGDLAATGNTETSDQLETITDQSETTTDAAIDQETKSE